MSECVCERVCVCVMRMMMLIIAEVTESCEIVLVSGF